MALEEPLSLYTLLSKYNDLLENYETLKASYEDLLANVNTQQEEIDYIYDNGVQSLGEVTASATTLDEGSSASVGVTSEKKKSTSILEFPKAIQVRMEPRLRLV